jgi:hypothetical protein
MFIGLLAISAAILLSIVSAIFSITGIITIFSGATLGAGVMAGVLEFSKVSATVWLYSFWKKANVLLKTYFLTAIVILIVISTIGIYGFLAHAYVGQGESAQSVKTEIEYLRQSIENEEKSMERAQTQIDQMDKNFSDMLEGNFITKGLEMRQEYEKERKEILSRISEARGNINEYQDKLLTLQQELNTLEVEVGPVKYLAALLYGEEKAEEFYDNAARLLIILIVIVFDPFAVLLMVAGNIALDRKPKSKRGRPKGSKNKRVKEKPIQQGYQPSQEKMNQEVTPPKGGTGEVPPKIHKRRRVVVPKNKNS